MTATALGGTSLLRDGKETVVVGGARYTQKQCFIRAAELDPRSAKAWVSLATVLREDERVVVGGQLHDACSCLAAGVTAQTDIPAAWKRLGQLLYAGAGGTDLHTAARPDAAAVPVTLPEKSGSATGGDATGAELVLANPRDVCDAQGRPTITVAGNRYTAPACFAIAATLDPTDASALASLAQTMTVLDSYSVNNVTCTKADVLARLRALTGSAAWSMPP